MKDEDIDWKIYHLLPDGVPTQITDLMEQTGLDEETVRSSLARLEKSCLVMVEGNFASPLSITDFFLAKQLTEFQKVEDDMGIFLENGVIKVRK